MVPEPITESVPVSTQERKCTLCGGGGRWNGRGIIGMGMGRRMVVMVMVVHCYSWSTGSFTLEKLHRLLLSGVSSFLSDS